MRGGHVVPAANTNTHPGWNSKNPKNSSMELHRAGGRRINQGGRGAANHRHQHNEGQEKTGTEREGWCENNCAQAPRLFAPPPPTALAVRETLHSSRDGSYLRFRLQGLVWESSRRLTQRLRPLGSSPSIHNAEEIK